jgi:hypothetical protein
MSRRGGYGLVRVLGTPGDEITVLRERGLDQLIEHVVDAVADGPRVEYERVTIQFLQPTDMTHGSHAIRTRLMIGIRHFFGPVW